MTPNTIKATVNVGEHLTLRLPENGGAGYLWDVDAIDPKVAKVTSDTCHGLDVGVGIGGPNSRVIIVEGAGKGETTFSHRRPWSGETMESCTITCV